MTITAPATPDAERWQGWGTALKPAFEPIVLARKPLSGTVAANVLEHGTGALNMDGTRIGTDDDERRTPYRDDTRRTASYGGTGTIPGRWRPSITTPLADGPPTSSSTPTQRRCWTSRAGKRPAGGY